MTNKTITLSRELVEKCLRDALIIRFSTDSHVEGLRAALDHQSAPADKGQGEPLVVTAEMEEAGCQAYMDADGMIGIMHRSSMGHAYRAMRALEQPAPVAVVMPERNIIRTSKTLVMDGTELTQVWNACLDEFVRLNSELLP